MNTIKIFDTTLRDGEQSPGASMTMEQKYEIANQLARLGVDVIEAGFPISSPHQFDACKYIAERVKGPVIAALARSVPADIQAAGESIKPAERKRIHTFIATSPIHMEYKLKSTPEQVIERAIAGVKLARNYTDDVEFSPEDGTRSELPFLCRILEAVIDAGATTLNIPDTVGYSEPHEFGAFIKGIMNGVPNIDKAIVSVHCHNDLGLALANTIEGIKNGARQAEVTVNGIGERAGNAALEELVMALSVRNDVLPFTTNIDAKQIYNTSRLLANIISMPVSRNKPIVGENAFSHESGIHQDGMLKNRETYEIMTPQSVGREMSQIVLGRHSGLHGVKNRLTELGLSLGDDELKRAYETFLKVADKKKEVFDEDLITIANGVLGIPTASFTLDYFNIISGNMSVPTATVRIKTDEEMFEEAATGDGPVDAIFKAIDRITGLTTILKRYDVRAVTSGKQAMGDSSVSLEINGDIYKGKGSSTDILEASAKAYVNAINRYKILSRNKETKNE
ncbi:MAG: 2-isopropylmalate synthase [Spirochaetales bacterium]|nr:2-isopropylmalate synthase [Spirochaetales bacterium]